MSSPPLRADTTSSYVRPPNKKTLHSSHYDSATDVLVFSGIGGHTNTERGYLPILAQKLSAQLKNEVGTESNPQQTSDLRTWEVYVSKKDKHPLQIV